METIFTDLFFEIAFGRIGGKKPMLQLYPCMQPDLSCFSVFYFDMGYMDFQKIFDKVSQKRLLKAI